MLTTRLWIPTVALLLSLLATGCGHSSDDPQRTQTQSQTQPQTQAQTFTVTAGAGPGGSITPTSVSVTEGESTLLTVTSNTGFSIASITPAGCTGTLVGNAFITGPITAHCAVAASFAANTFNVTTSAGTGGSITPASFSVAQGANALLTVTPNNGYNITSVTPNGCTGTRSGNTYTTGPITADCAITASFALATSSFTVTASAGAGGSITPASVSVSSGASTLLTVTPNTGFNITSVTASGCSGTLAGTTFTTGPITANCTITASFALPAATYTVTASAGDGGSITPASVSVTEGARAVLTMTPNTGFSIASVTASGCSGTLAGTAYTTGPITAICSVAASFAIAPTTYTVSASAGVGGSITPSSISVIEGVSAVLTVTPNAGFSIAGIVPTGCTGTLAGNTYTTGPITAPCTVVASFVASVFTVTASAGAGGSITPASASVSQGASALLTVTPATGFNITGVVAAGCSGTLSGITYTTGPITADCAVTASFALAATTSVASKIAAGGYHTCAITSAGAVQCWGSNGYGELGNGSTLNSVTPVAVTGLSEPVLALVAGAQHTCALTSAGAVFCWGYNPYGQLGNGSTTNSTAPVTVTGLSGPATALAAGSYNTCALTRVGAVQCWGYNANGQLGNGSTANASSPVTVTGLSGSATMLAAGPNHTCALTSAVQCWGGNASGQLGDGRTTNSTIPVTVTGLSGTATTLAAGFGHTCALTSTGTVQCWGGNSSGQLGNGSTTNSTAPVTVAGLSDPATALVAGNTHTCALSSAGSAQCWGGNGYGQLGNGGTTSTSTPVAVSGLSGTITSLVAGYGHNCALTSVGATQCWGYNLYGQLGNGSTTNSAIPVNVTGLSGP